jgi:hypothetical protein
MLLTVAVPLLLPLLVCQPGASLYVLLTIAILLLLSLLVYQPGTSLYVMLTVAVPLLLPGCGGHAVQIVPLAISDRQGFLRGDVHSSCNASRHNIL